LIFIVWNRLKSFEQTVCSLHWNCLLDLEPFGTQ